jgi:Methane oxygenase PmoA
MKKCDWVVRLTAARLAGTLAVLCAVAVPQTVRGASAYTLTPTENGKELKTPDGRVVFEYLTKKPAGVPLTSPSAACFHPVNTPSGIRVTNIAPNDHLHHRGIFFGWHDAEFHTPEGVVKADFWGWGSLSPREGRVVETRDVKLASADDKQAKVEIHNEWMVNGKKMGDEFDSATVTERDKVYVLDLEYRIAPTYDYIAHENAFGGFDVQCRKDGEAYYSNLYGKTTYADSNANNPGLDLPDFGWYDFTIRVFDLGKVVGAAVINHPDNGATAWHLVNNLFMLNPVTVFAQPEVIKAGTSRTLRYRVVVHDGPSPTWVLQKLAMEYRGGH